MRRELLLALLLAAGRPAAAGDTASAPAAGKGTRGPDVDVVVPVAPYEHERLHFFGKQEHHVVPGTVTINNRTPYVCDLDAKRFRDRDAFLAHLVGTHHLSVDAVPDRLLVRDGTVHFVGK